MVIPLRNNKVARVTRQKDSGLNAAGRVPALRPGMKNNPATAAITANGTAPIKLNASDLIDDPAAQIGPTAGPMTMPMPTGPILARSWGSNTRRACPSPELDNAGAKALGETGTDHHRVVQRV